LYDWVSAHNYLVDWSRPAETQRILLTCILAQMGLILILYWVPWYLLFLFAGNVGLLAMSPYIRAFAKVYGVEFMLYSQERAVLHTSTLMRRPHTVSVFENQRWWLGFGWIPRLGSNERSKWSDQTGKVRYASLNDFMPEDGFEWVDEGGGWEVDRIWALPVHTDEDGWVYTDNFWKHPAAAASAVSSYTRRRRWVRKVRPANRLDAS
ncbi:hypothetical protein GGF42_002653, partial [Coemansia sp. RSA 2424]